MTLLTSEISMAFAHPYERSVATASNDRLDRISVRDHVVDVEIGAFQTERGITQRVRFNVVVEVLPFDPEIDDDVDCILSYDKITDAITFELNDRRINLLETLAEKIASRILIEPQAERVFVRIEKLDRGASDLGVEIMRRAMDLGTSRVVPEKVPQPQIVYLSNAAMAAPHLETWIDQLSASTKPLLICVGLPDEPVVQAQTPQAQQQINLLAIEQNAWCLTALDPRCVVVRTRTELEWAMRNGQISVWAPAKIVLDTVDTPEISTYDPLELSVWFAQSLNAPQMRVIGAPLIETSEIKLIAQNVDAADIA